MKTILLTGGGTAGHVTPNLALIPSLKAAGYDIRYIGSYNGMERKLIENAGIPSLRAALLRFLLSSLQSITTFRRSSTSPI